MGSPVHPRFSQYSSRYSHTAAQIPPPDTSMELETLNSADCTYDDCGYFLLVSRQIHFSDINNLSAPADAPEDGRPCSTDADMLGVNAAAAAAAVQASLPVPVGDGYAAPWCATGSAENQQPEVEDAQRRFDSWKSDVEQHLFEEVEPSSLTVPDGKLVEAPAPVSEDGRPYSADADMPEVNDAATQTQAGGPLPVAVEGVPFACASATSEHVEEEAQRRFGSFKSAVLQDLTSTPHNPIPYAVVIDALERLEKAFMSFIDRMDSEFGDDLPEPSDTSTEKRWSIVRFTGPDSKGRNPHHRGRKPHQSRLEESGWEEMTMNRTGMPHRRRWKEKSMKGMRAAADASAQPPGQQQQLYVGLKKTLELEDDGNGNKWRAHEYTPLLRSDDGSNKLTTADISLRVVFEEDLSSLSSSSSKRSRTGVPKDPKNPVKSPVWEHMTKVHVKVATTTNADRSQRNNACYKVMYAICHHCDKVFNADSGHGTNNQSKHLSSCNNSNCNCTHSY